MSHKAAAKAHDNRSYWQSEIEKANKRFKVFQEDGDRVVDEYRQQKDDGNNRSTRDKYNILYSSTETIRPNLYAQRPTVRVVLRNKDTAPDYARDGAELLQNCGEYLITEQDFDNVMESVTEDLLLPGLGQGWVRYEPNIEYEYGEDKRPVLDEQGQHVAKLLDEKILLEYLYWKDFITGAARTWATVPWVAKRCWMAKDAATARFGKEKADRLQYSQKERDGRETDSTSDTAEIWEIWCKRTKEVYWYAQSFPDGLLDKKSDPLKLKGFWPCPRPLRAVATNDRIVPRSLYSQYKDQAEQVNNITRRIRLLTDALKVAGAYNGANEKLADIISPLSGNKMIAIQDWHSFKGDGGVSSQIEWLPLADVVNALTQLLSAREVAKAEIYEITGFSDILRGVSKASETLGAQNIKAQWGGARLKRMQKEVQRFARDMIAIAGEIVAETCSDESIALYGGVHFPEVNPQDPASQQAAQAIAVRFQAAVKFIRDESRRVAAIDIETDSTLLADETAERADRMAFLGAAGAFLQQAVPAMENTPEMGPLLAAMLMFTVRTFPSSRVIEDAFEDVSKAMAQRPPKQPEPDPNAGKLQIAQMAAQSEQARLAAEGQMKQAEMQAKSQYEMAKIQNEQQAENNRHGEKIQELQIREREVGIKEAELQLKEAELGIKQQVADHTAAHDAAELELDAETAAADIDVRQMELDFERDALAIDTELREQEAEAASREAEQKPLTGSED